MNYQNSNEDYLEHLTRIHSFLIESCKRYDEGNKVEAFLMAPYVRNLVHDTNKSTSLLQHLNKKNIKFSAVGFRHFPENLAPSNNLVIMRIGGGHPAVYIPKLNEDEAELGFKMVSFNTWWQEIIFRNPQLEKIEGLEGKLSTAKNISRKQLILTMSNKDGVSHIDKKLPINYAELSRGSKGGWSTTDQQGNSIPISDGPHLASMRTIAEEVLRTLEIEFELS